MSLGQEIKKFRADNSLSQRKFAKECGISPTTVLKIEFGKDPGLIVTGKIKKFMENYKKEV